MIGAGTSSVEQHVHPWHTGGLTKRLMGFPTGFDLHPEATAKMAKAKAEIAQARGRVAPCEDGKGKGCDGKGKSERIARVELADGAEQEKCNRSFSNNADTQDIRTRLQKYDQHDAASQQWR